MRFGSEPGDDEDAAQREARIEQARAQSLRRQWLSAQTTLRDTRFPIYAADGWPSQLGGNGSQGGRITEITVRHSDTPDFDPTAGDQPRLVITTKHDDSRLGGPSPIAWCTSCRVPTFLAST